MTLSKALKQKNRLASELKIQEDIFKRENSRTITSTSKVQPKDVYDNIGKLKHELSQIKSAILIASAPIQEKIIHIGELRGLISLIKSVSKQDGEIASHSYGREPLKETYTAFMTEGMADDETKKIQKQIDQLQDEIDAFNATTKIAQ